MTAPTCVIYNPAAGRGRAKRLLGRLPPALAKGVELRPSERPGHGEELARLAALDGFARVVAAGGDGTVHEVANGLLAGGRRDVVFATWPLGSMNDYADTLGVSRWWAERRWAEPLAAVPADVGVARAGGRSRYFVNGCGVGFNGLVALESGRIRRLRGLALYATAFLRVMAGRFATPRAVVRFDGTEADGPTLGVSFNLGRREGGFPVTPAARIDDGLFDALHAARVRRWELVRYLPALIAGTLPADHPELRPGRCAAGSVRSSEPLCVHLDGELLCRPEDGVRELEVELLPGRLTVEVWPPGRDGAR